MRKCFRIRMEERSKVLPCNKTHGAVEEATGQAYLHTRDTGDTPPSHRPLHPVNAIRAIETPWTPAVEVTSALHKFTLYTIRGI
jgi:hypothetical protein